MSKTTGTSSILNKTLGSVKEIENESEVFKNIWDIRMTELNNFFNNKEDILDYFNQYKADFKNMRKQRKYTDNDVDIILDTLVMEKITKDFNLNRDFNRLFRYHSRLASSVTKKFLVNNYNLEFDEIFQQGLLGLRIAILRFNYHLGYKFSTYSHLWISQSIIRYIQSNKDIIYLPSNKSDKLNKFIKAIDKGLKKEQILDELKLNEKSYDAFQDYHKTRFVYSLDKPSVSHDGMQEKTLLDVTVIENYDSDYHIDKDEFYKIIRELIPDDRQYKILTMRLEGKSLQEIGEYFGISRERVRQLENRIYQCIKNNKKLVKNRLELY